MGLQRTGLEALRSALGSARTCLLWLLDGIALAVPVRRQAHPADIALIRLDAIGDFVLWIDAAARIREVHKERHITLVIPSAHASLAEALPYWDAVYAVDVPRLTQQPAYRWSALRSLRRRGFQVSVHPTQSRTFLVGDAVVRACHAQERIGALGDCTNLRPWQKRISDRYYTQLVDAGNEHSMELVRNAAFLSALTGQRHVATTPQLPVLPPLDTRLNDELSATYFVIFPGASWSGRRWQASKFAQLANELRAETGWLPVLCGGPADVSVCDQVAAQIRSEVVNLAGQTSLLKLARVMEGAKLVVTNETSAAHIGPSVRTPTVCIVGGGHFGRFVPYGVEVRGPHPAAVFETMPCYGCNWHCSRPHQRGEPVPCIARVEVSSVLKAALAIIRASEPPPF